MKVAMCLWFVQAESEAREWQERWQQAVKELADVKERAWSLLEEKDTQLQALKVCFPAVYCTAPLKPATPH